MYLGRKKKPESNTPAYIVVLEPLLIFDVALGLECNI